METPGKADDVKQRQIQEGHIVCAQLLLHRVQPRAPQHVRVGPDDSLRKRRGAGREHQGGGILRHGREQRRWCGVKIGETQGLFGRRRFTCRRSSIVLGHGNPAQVTTMARDEGSEFRLRDRADRARRFCEMGELRSNCHGIRSDADGADPGAGEARQQSLRAIFKMDEHAIATLDTACTKTAPDRGDFIHEAPISPYVRLRSFARPDQEGAIRLNVRETRDPRADIHAGERRDRHRLFLIHTASLPARRLAGRRCDEKAKR
jgi:hypothetical protein